MGAGERIVTANGVELCAEPFGDPNEPAILLIQGVGGSMDWWEDEFCAQLAAGGRYVIRYDNRDTGRSVTYEPGAPTYSLTDLAGDAVGLLDAFDVPAAQFVGISMGGMVSQLAALDHADRVRALTLISTSPASPSAGEPDLPGISEKLLAYFGELVEPDWSDPASATDYIVGFGGALAGSRPPFDEVGTRNLVGRVLARSTNVAASMTNHDIVINGPERWRDRLGQVAVPTLVIHGTEDPLFPFGHGEALAAAIPGARLQPLEGVGHELPAPVWDEVVPAILHNDAG